MFTSSDVVVLGKHQSSDGSPIATLTMGSAKTTMFFPMLDVSKGNQTDRIQVDVSLAGSMHVSGGVNNGVGVYQMQFLDGPIVDPEKLFGGKADKKQQRTMAEQFFNAKTIQDRQIQVKLFSAASKCNSKGDISKYSSKPIATFTGIATTIQLSLSGGDEECRTITTQVDAIGSWSY